jgi:hypothetical protein
MKNPYDYLKSHEGEILTYRQLCDLIGEELKRGRAKELHLNSLRQYLDLDQESIPRKIVLKEVYSTNDIRITGGRGKFFPFIKNSLLQQMQSERTLVMTYAELVKTLGLASDKYMCSRYDKATDTLSIKEKFANEIETASLSRINQYNFFIMSWTIIREILRSSLRQMETQELIQITYSLRLLRKESFVNPQGKTIEYMEKHNLNSMEHKQYVEIQETVVKQFQLSGLQELFYRSTGSTKIKDAQETYHRALNLFVRSLGYTDSATLLILSLTSKGEKVSIDERYLDKATLQRRIKEKIAQEDSFEEVIPTPSLEKFIEVYL